MNDRLNDYDSRMSVCGSGPAVVLVPGLDGTGQLFYRQVPLLEKSYSVATYALRDDAKSMDVLADDLRSVVELTAPEEKRAIVIGESFGGAVALTMALRHPEHVSRLVILNSFPYFAPQFLLQLGIAGVSIIPWGAMGLVRYVTSIFLSSRHTGRDELKRFRNLTVRTTRLGYKNRLQLLRTYDVRERLREVRCLTLFLAAEKDRLVPSVTQARLMAQQVPLSTMRILSGHGHICLIAPDINLCDILTEWQT
jgi:pimeloyl-ACP methyl ester carboxylesterase